jgi:hypothetical protein
MTSKVEASIDALIDCLDGSGSDSEWKAVDRLRETLNDDLPKYLLARYKSQGSWKARSSYVYHATRYAKESEAAIELGKLAVSDKSSVVRYRACKLLAYSLRRELLPFLEQERFKATDEKTLGDIEAAMDAIAEQNHNFFADRDHSGKVTLNIR